MTDLGVGRRTFLTASAAAAGWLAARGLGVHGLGGPPDTRSVRETLEALVASLSDRQRDQVLLPRDHPSRQITNAITFLERPHVGTLFTPSQLELVARLRDAMLSEKGRVDLAGTFAVEGKFEGCVLAVYGDPFDGPSQATLMGGHVHLRCGDLGREPFGGGVSYGHQIGNEQWRIPGNSFAHHGDAANAVYAALDETSRTRAVEARAPVELVVQPQPEGGRFDGLRIGDANEAGRARADALLDTVLSHYPAAEARAARDAIDANGGLDELRLAFYESHGFYEDMQPIASLDAAERARRGAPYWQVWRLEGPGTVIHFQGHPHVHAYVQIVRDPRRWHTGDALGRVDRTVEGEEMRDLLEGAMRRATGVAHAFHAEEVFGRFCAGDVTTGLAWSVDPYGNRLARVDIEGRAMAAPLRERLARKGLGVEAGETVTIATTDYFASRGDLVGEPQRVEVDDRRLGEALVEHLAEGALVG